MNGRQIVKYKIGLLVIGLFTLALLVVLLVQAGPTRQDVRTDKLANSMADSLNSYTDANFTVPASLERAGIHKTSPYISYTRLSDSKYKFCVTYKTTSRDFDPSMAVDDALTTGEGLAVPPMLPGGGLGGDTVFGSDLYIPTSHHKGVNCQTVDIGSGGSGGVGGGCDFSSASGAETVCPLQSGGTSDALDVCGQAYDAASEESIVTAVTATSIQIASPEVPPYTLPITAKAKFFDVDCQPIALNSIHVGDTVTVYSGMAAGGAVAVQESGL